MARSLRDIRRKMKAIKSTRQVTKAMELVAASKMRKAVDNAQRLKRYALTAWEILERVAQGNEEMHPFLAPRPGQRVLALLFTSDRGLCGSLNAQILKATAQYRTQVQTHAALQQLNFIAVGRKGQQFLSRTGQSVVAAFPALSNHPKFKDVLPIARLAMESFLEGKYDHVVLIYADFRSALVQEPTVKVLLPFTKTALKEMISGLGHEGPSQIPDSPSERLGRAGSPQIQRKYLFEPSPEQILSTILPQLTEMQIYQAVLESAASEHSARMVAMRNASDNASDILDDLTLTYNQTRQANITGELSELSAAVAALG